jgi:uncharacterized protein YndB with AHSA1/START domain
METMLIKKTIDIHAPKEKIWNVLLDDHYSRQWYAEFSEGTYAVTDWNEGSKVIFQDESKSGIVGTIISKKPGEELVIEYNGMIYNGVENFESDDAKAVKGFRECYWLTESDGAIRLDIQSDMGSDYFEMMSAAWDKALAKIKAFAEN